VDIQDIQDIQDILLDIQDIQRANPMVIKSIIMDPSGLEKP